MAVQAGEAVAVVDGDVIAVNRVIGRGCHSAALGCINWGCRRGLPVHAIVEAVVAGDRVRPRAVGTGDDHCLPEGDTGSRRRRGVGAGAAAVTAAGVAAVTAGTAAVLLPLLCSGRSSGLFGRDGLGALLLLSCDLVQQGRLLRFVVVIELCMAAVSLRS